jgi:hypothetical protein
MYRFVQSRQTLAITFAVLLAAAASHAQIASPPAQSGAGFRIGGTVVNAISGSPLAGARVTIQDARTFKISQSTIASADGHFEFTHLAAGKYALQAVKPGFTPAAYEQHEQFSTAIVTGAGLDTEHLILRLPPFAVISGKVFDENGEPLRHAMIWLYAEDRRVGVNQIHKTRAEQTDDQGSYEFAQLPAGTYFLSASTKPWYAVYGNSSPAQAGENGSAINPTVVDPALDVAYPITYYKDTTEPDGALPIPARPGDHLEADIHLNPVPALHVFFHPPDKGERGFSSPMLQVPSLDGWEQVQDGSFNMVTPGVYELTGVPAGRYSVRNTNLPADSDQPPQSSETEMELTSNGQELDTAGGEAASNLHATVTMQDNEKLPAHLTLLLRNEKLRVVTACAVNDKGEADFQNISPGRYELLPQGSGRAYAVVRVSIGEHASSGHIVDVPAGASVAVSLTLAGSAMQVEGFAKKNGKAAVAAMVVLVPRNPESNLELFRRDQTDLDGSFDLRDVIPGTYTVCAIENGWDLDWSRRAVISSYCQNGTPVVVSSGSAGSQQLQAAVEVHVK